MSERGRGRGERDGVKRVREIKRESVCVREREREREKEREKALQKICYSNGLILDTVLVRARRTLIKD